MKKRISVLLLAVILTGCPFAFAMQTFSMPATVEGSIFGGQPSDRIAVKVTFDTTWWYNSRRMELM